MKASTSEVVKDITVAVCCVALTISTILLTREIRLLFKDIRHDINTVAVNVSDITYGVNSTLKTLNRQALFDDEMRQEVVGSLKNVRSTTNEARLALGDIRGTVQDTRKLVVNLDDNLNNKILPEIHLQIKETGSEVKLAVTEIKNGIATLTADTSNDLKAIRELIEHSDKVITDNQTKFNEILKHVDTVVLNVGDMTANTASITRTLDIWTKDTFKKKSMIIRVASGIVGAILPRILQ